MDNAERAVEEQRHGRDFYFSDNEQLEKYLIGAVKLNSKPIPTNRFNEFETTRFAFGESAEDYGNFLKKMELKKCLFGLQICKINLLQENSGSGGSTTSGLA